MTEKSIAEYFADFDKIAYDKIKVRREKYGELTPDCAKYEDLCGHMLEEIAEWIYVEYGPEHIIEALAYLISKVHEAGEEYDKHDAEENIVTELADIYNMARIMYMTGTHQGDI